MKKFLIGSIFFGFLFLFFPAFSGVFAATLQLDPATVSTPSGKTFDLKVTIDTGTDTVKSADAWVLYDPAILQPLNVTDGTFFSTPVNKDLSTSGKAYVSGMVDDPTKPVSGKGTIATITFKALTDGTNTLKFDCTDGATNGSLIIKADSTDANIIVCAQNGTSAVTVGTGVNVSPTTALTGQLTPTPSILPKSGIFDNVIKFAVPGTAFLLIGLALRLL